MALGGRGLDDDLAQARVDVPVDLAEVVAGGVAAVVDEFEAAAALGTGAAATEPGDDRLDPGDAQRFQLAQVPLAIEEPGLVTGERRDRLFDDRVRGDRPGARRRS